MVGSPFTMAAAAQLMERARRSGEAMGLAEASSVLTNAAQASPPATTQANAEATLASVTPIAAARSLERGQDVGVPGTDPFREPALVHEPGGDFIRELLHPQLVIFEELYRVLPDDAWFQPTVSPAQPIQFELGSFTVPNGQQLWVYDYEFSVFRLSGMDAGDFVKAEAGRFAGVLGFDITVNGRRPAHLLYQLDPIPVPVTRQSFDPQNQSVAASFTRSSFNSFAANASPALSLLPVRRAVQGAEGAPFTLVAQQGDKVALSCVIFKQVKSPIATIEARHAGFLLQTNLAETLINRMRPR
jgi:hypothetical protein